MRGNEKLRKLGRRKEGRKGGREREERPRDWGERGETTRLVSPDDRKCGGENERERGDEERGKRQRVRVKVLAPRKVSN